MNNLGLTRREKIALIIAASLALLFLFIPQTVLDEWEYPYLVFVVFPSGSNISTDPERIKCKP